MKNTILLLSLLLLSTACTSVTKSNLSHNSSLKRGLASDSKSPRSSLKIETIKTNKLVKGAEVNIVIDVNKCVVKSVYNENEHHCDINFGESNIFILADKSESIRMDNDSYCMISIGASQVYIGNYVNNVNYGNRASTRIGALGVKECLDKSTLFSKHGDSNKEYITTDPLAVLRW